jgi:hypothetical protein
MRWSGRRRARVEHGARRLRIEFVDLADTIVGDRAQDFRPVPLAATSAARRKVEG